VGKTLVVSAGSLVIALLIGTGSGVSAQPPGQRWVAKGNVPNQLHGAVDLGRTQPDLRLERMILVLALRPGSAAQRDAWLADLQDPASPSYHRWLTPAEYGEQFGLSDRDLARVTSWLEQQGFVIDEVAKGRGWVNFSGTAAQVEIAFATEMHDFAVNGEVHHANITDPAFPAELSGLLHGIASLHSFRHPAHHSSPAASPELTIGRAHSLGPADFATIYDLNPAYQNGLDGTGESIAIVSRSEIQLFDVHIFRNYFGLPQNDPVVIHNGPPPNELFLDDFVEAALDTQWSGAIAPKAKINVVISASTATTDGVDLAAQAIVDQDIAPVMSTSFGQCEALMGRGELSFFSNLWAQAAAEGITAFVSSGDSGAAGCNASGDARGKGKGVNGLCSSANDVCVGGTQFNEGKNPGAYWTTPNLIGTGGFARSYIPEIAWNESALTPGGVGLAASGGGASLVVPKPSWQAVKGVPADGRRDVPDVALNSAEHDGYIITIDDVLYRIAGTSAASPSFAGIMALVNQKTGSKQGNANPTLYALGAAQYSGGGPAVFHDITGGTNSVPHQVGFACGPGYDLVTGLGSVDASALINAWP
jgi:pseudomonalisin